MRIVIIGTYPQKGERHSNKGGVASYTKNLVDCLSLSQDDELYVLCDKANTESDSYTENNVNVIRCFDKNIRCFYQLLKEVNKIMPDVIHIQQELSLYGSVINAYLLQWFLLLLNRYKVVITLHGVVSRKLINVDFVRENGSALPVLLVKIAFYLIYAPLCQRSDKQIVHEEYFKEILITEYGANERCIDVIPHGVEDLVMSNREDARAALSIPARKKVILFMGYLAGYKGLDLLIDGFAQYAKKFQDAFLIIGAGKHPKIHAEKAYVEEYERLVNKASDTLSGDQFRWVGFIRESEIQNFISASDLLVFPYTISMSSSGPMAFAMGFEKQFLASDVFEKVFDRKMLFRRDAQSFSDALEDFFKNPEVLLSYVKELREVRLWSVVGKRTYTLYRSLLI